MTNVTDEEFTEALRAAVEERGEDYSYPEGIYEGQFDIPRDDDYHNGGLCVYQTPDGTPACIIGLALYKIDPELVPDYDLVMSAQKALEDIGVSDRVRFAAGRAQGVQDGGDTWGHALREYEDALARYFD